MNKSLSRRDFLKLLAAVPPGYYLSRLLQESGHIMQNSGEKNVLIVVFDTWSAKNVPFLGYARETTPNLSRVADRATFYHNHYAGGNWTTPGTATLLTGTYPWTHRAFSQSDFVAKDKEKHNIFNTFEGYYRLGYSHNSIADRFLHQFSEDIELVIPQKKLFTTNALSFDRLFPWDGDIASLTWDRIAARSEEGYSYSLFFSHFYEKYEMNIADELLKDFPRGIPHTGDDDYFLLEDGISRMISQFPRNPQPFFGYFHFLPPHRPYFTRQDFVNAFADDGVGYYIEKPKHPLFSQAENDKPLNLDYQAEQRQLYDEFILYVDEQFGRLFNFMEESGLLENTWVVVTSDHGELFERGIFGHRTPVLYQPVIQIPLIIFEPGQTQRRDIFTPTSAVDVLPTMLKVTGQPIPDWAEGQVVSPFAETPPDPDRSIFALEATDSKDTEPLNPATVMLVKGKYKLTYYFGYQEIAETGPFFELFDLEEDPEELNNIYAPDSEIVLALQNELLEKIKEVDAPYRSS
ncbi:MAG: sulfatase-like hydrolase/transferase [Anaerolineales bacterium]